jgi:hypothetical protein
MTTGLMHRTRDAANAASASEVSGFASPSEKVQIVGSKVFITGTDKGLVHSAVPASEVVSLCGVLFPPLVRSRE